MAAVTAISSLAWSNYSIHEALPRIAELGFERMEIASFPSYCLHFNSPSPTPLELKDTMQSLGLSPVCLNFWGGPRWAWSKEDIDAFISLSRGKFADCVSAGIPMMALQFCFYNERPDREEQLEAAAGAYSVAGEIACRSGIKTVVELPHMHSICRDVDSVVKLLDQIDSDNVGVLVDTSHWGAIQYDMEHLLDQVGDLLWHVHLRDAKRNGNTPEESELELTPGKGTVDFARLGRLLDKMGYSGDVSLEFEYRDVPLETIEREIDAGLRSLTEAGWTLPGPVAEKMQARRR